ncbi:MAG: ATP-binding protein, partial [Planctomycetota bacterium]
FEPFYTTKEAHGTGLGLAVVKSVVVRYAGDIDIQSEPGLGTNITVSLPRDIVGDGSGQKEARPAEDGQSRSKATGRDQSQSFSSL